jgi:hypothetical protein
MGLKLGNSQEQKELRVFERMVFRKTFEAEREEVTAG